MAIPDGELLKAMEASQVTHWGSDNDEDLQNAIVLSGYLRRSGFSETEDPDEDGEPKVLWRIYLSAQMDVYVDFVGADVVRVAVDAAAQHPLRGAVTIWLTTIPPKTRAQKRYFISTPLVASPGFLSSEQLEIPYLRSPPGFNRCPK